MTTNTPDDYNYNARELRKAAPRSGETDPDKLPRLKAWGPNGESRTLVIDASQYFRVVEALSTDPGITYRVQAHDITTLTWPMWEACGIECPAMIGADCPGNGSGQYMDGPADAAHHSKRCPGWSAKFPNAAAEVVHGWTFSSFEDERCGGENGGTWFALFRTPEDERRDDNPMGAGVILCTITSGAVSLTRFDSEEELTRDWAKIIRDVEPGLCRHCSDELDNSDGQLVSVETGEATCGANPDGDTHEIEETD